MKLTTELIIKVLPIGQELKTKLLAEWPSIDPNRKFHLEQYLWDTYEALYQLKLQENLQLGMLRAKDNQEALDPEFYARMRKLTEKQLQDAAEENTTSTDLDLVRTKLQNLLSK